MGFSRLVFLNRNSGGMFTAAKVISSRIWANLICDNSLVPGAPTREANLADNSGFRGAIHMWDRSQSLQATESCILRYNCPRTCKGREGERLKSARAATKAHEGLTRNRSGRHTD